MQTPANQTDSFTEEQGQILIRLARHVIAKKLGLAVDREQTAQLAAALQDHAFDKHLGIFVTLHINGRLRGCIGSLTGFRAVREGVMYNAENAAFEDHRFQPLTKEEFDKIDIEVSILSEPEPLLYHGASDLVKRLRPRVDGVILKKDYASATFLPQVWEQLPHPEDFLGQLCIKAGLHPEAWRTGEILVETYQVQYFKEIQRL
jgi:AmmeMemoRadiSam system protein A